MGTEHQGLVFVPASGEHVCPPALLCFLPIPGEGLQGQRLVCQPGLGVWRPLPYRGELDVDRVMAGQELLGVPELGQVLLSAASRHHLLQEKGSWQVGVH